MIKENEILSKAKDLTGLETCYEKNQRKYNESYLKQANAYF